MERNRSHELVQGIGIGLVAIALSSCVPTNTKAYYNPFNDQITYAETPIPQVVIHEETHKERANGYKFGRIGWGIRYTIDRIFACQEEEVANLQSGLYPIDDHPACR